MSARFMIDRSDVNDILSVLGWSVASALVAAVITLLAHAQVDPRLAAFIPLVNTVLYAIKLFLENNQPKRP